MQFFLGKLAPLHVNWNPYPLRHPMAEIIGYLAPPFQKSLDIWNLPAKNPRILDTPLKYSQVVIHVIQKKQNLYTLSEQNTEIY